MHVHNNIALESKQMRYGEMAFVAELVKKNNTNDINRTRENPSQFVYTEKKVQVIDKCWAVRVLYYTYTTEFVLINRVINLRPDGQKGEENIFHLTPVRDSSKCT